MTVLEMRIAYLARVLPCLSETFVVREMAALRRRGTEVKAFSIHPPDAVASPEIPDLLNEVEVLVRPFNPFFWLAHLFFALAFPGRYWGCVGAYVLRDRHRQGQFRRRWQYFAIAPFAAWRLRSSGIDHLHAHFANAATTVAMMAARLAGISFSFTLHSFYETFLDNLLLPEKLAAAKAVVSISHYYRDILQRLYPDAAAKIEVVRCGIDAGSYAPNPHPRNDPPLLLSVGRLSDTKGFPALIRACARLRDQGLKVECRIIGDGPDREELENLVAELDLSGQVVLLGKLQPAEVKTGYRQGDLLALPCCYSKDPQSLNNHDCIPYVLVEAMAMGLPVISTRLGGIPELIRDGETGLLVEPDDLQGLAEAVARLLQDEGLAGKLANAGRKYVLQEFSADRNAEKLQMIFSGAMGRR